MTKRQEILTQFTRFGYFIAPLLAVMGPKLIVTLIVGLAIIQGIGISTTPFRLTKEGLLLFLLILFSFLSYFWSMDPFLTIRGSIHLLGIGILAYVYMQLPSPDDTLQKSFLWGVDLALFFIAADWIFGNPWQAFKHRSHAVYIQGGLFLSIALWPCLSILLKKNQKLVAVLFSGITLVFLTLIQCDTIIVALIFAFILAYGLSRVSSLKMIHGLFSLIVVGFLSTPWIVNTITTKISPQELNEYVHDISYVHRFIIWDKSSKDIVTNPWLGKGFRAYRSEKIPRTPEPFSFKEKDGKITPLFVESYGLHPHNIALHLYWELGILGAFLGGFLAAFLFKRCMQIQNRDQRFTALGFYISCMVILWINLGAFQHWWLSSMIFLIPFFKERPSHS